MTRSSFAGFAGPVNAARRFVWEVFGGPLYRSGDAVRMMSGKGAGMSILRTVSLVTLLLGAPGAALADDDDVSFESLPSAVQTTVQREVKGGQILDIERDTKQGKVVFEVEFVDAGTYWELHVAEDGKLLSRRQD